MSTTTQTQATTSQYTTSSTSAASNVTKVWGMFQKNLKRASPPDGGNGRGGGGGGGEGGGGRGRPQGPPAAQQPITQAQDVRVVGKLPKPFQEERAKAEQFIEAMKWYLCLNQIVAGFNSPIRKVTITLSNIVMPTFVSSSICTTGPCYCFYQTLLGICRYLDC